MGTLKLDVTDSVVFAHYFPDGAGPNNGGYLGRVFPGGAFLGKGFEELAQLGTGRHLIELDERVPSYRGNVPGPESGYRTLFEEFRFLLFMYDVGATSAREVFEWCCERLSP